MTQKITPSSGTPDAITPDTSPLSEQEIREKIVWELKHGKLGEDEMVRHLQYCVDHEVGEARERILLIARTKRRKWSVRKVAVEYVCRMLTVAELCEQVLPTLAGRQMIDVVERFKETEDPLLIDFVWNYGEYYGDQKMPCDAMAIEMQDRRGLASFRNHMERRGAVTKARLYPDPVCAIGQIYRVELLDELEKLLRLILKDSFRDRKDHGLRENLRLAFWNVATRGGEGAQVKVLELLRSYAARYPDDSEKACLLHEWIGVCCGQTGL